MPGWVIRCWGESQVPPHVVEPLDENISPQFSPGLGKPSSMASGIKSKLPASHKAPSTQLYFTSPDSLFPNPPSIPHPPYPKPSPLPRQDGSWHIGPRSAMLSSPGLPSPDPPSLATHSSFKTPSRVSFSPGNRGFPDAQLLVPLTCTVTPVSCPSLPGSSPHLGPLWILSARVSDSQAGSCLGVKSLAGEGVEGRAGKENFWGSTHKLKVVQHSLMKAADCHQPRRKIQRDREREREIKTQNQKQTSKS